MKEIHDLNNDLYEHLVDGEDTKAVKVIGTLTRKYKDIKSALTSNKIN